MNHERKQTAKALRSIRRLGYVTLECLMMRLAEHNHQIVEFTGKFFRLSHEDLYNLLCVRGLSYRHFRKVWVAYLKE